MAIEELLASDRLSRGYRFHFPVGHRNIIVGFIDNTIRKTPRPGGGPRVNGLRWHPLIQQAFYQGWKKCHGLKWQTFGDRVSIEWNYGITSHLFPYVDYQENN